MLFCHLRIFFKIFFLLRKCFQELSDLTFKWCRTAKHFEGNMGNRYIILIYNLASGCVLLNDFTMFGGHFVQQF